MSLLHPARVSSKHFSKVPHGFVAEYSELPFGFNLGRVYDDAVDVGFTMVSEETGTEVVFALEEEQVVDGEMVAHHFISVSPGYSGWKVILIND